MLDGAVSERVSDAKLLHLMTSMPGRATTNPRLSSRHEPLLGRPSMTRESSTAAELILQAAEKSVGHTRAGTTGDDAGDSVQWEDYDDGTRSAHDAGFGIKFLRHQERSEYPDKVLEYHTKNLEDKPWAIAFEVTRKASVLGLPHVRSRRRSNLRSALLLLLLLRSLARSTIHSGSSESALLSQVLRSIVASCLIAMLFVCLSLLFEEDVMTVFTAVNATVSAVRTDHTSTTPCDSGQALSGARTRTRDPTRRETWRPGDVPFPSARHAKGGRLNRSYLNRASSVWRGSLSLAGALLPIGPFRGSQPRPMVADAHRVPWRRVGRCG